jgi:hypothetical protein
MLLEKTKEVRPTFRDLATIEVYKQRMNLMISKVRVML